MLSLGNYFYVGNVKHHCVNGNIIKEAKQLLKNKRCKKNIEEIEKKLQIL